MYYYILDQNILSLEKFERYSTQLSALTAEFKIAGEMGRVTPLRSIADLVDTAAARGAKTLVACGSDDTFNVLLASLRGRDFTLGFIPLDEKSFIAKILGIENLFIGVKTIAGRRLEQIDLAKFSNNYLLSFLEFGVLSHNLKNLNWWNGFKIFATEPKKYIFRIDDSYNLEIVASGGLAANIRSNTTGNSSVANPTDGLLDLLILDKLNRAQFLLHKKKLADGLLEDVPKSTVIKCKKIQFLEPRGTPLTMLGRIITKFPATVEIMPHRLRLIVGKNRTF